MFIQEASAPNIRSCIVSVASGLQFLHGLGFIHSDLKPANILVQARVSPWRVRVADLGSAVEVTSV
jgi:serine/threonine protein kinase